MANTNRMGRMVKVYRNESKQTIKPNDNICNRNKSEDQNSENPPRNRRRTTHLLDSQRDAQKVAHALPLELLVRVEVCRQQLLAEVVPQRERRAGVLVIRERRGRRVRRGRRDGAARRWRERRVGHRSTAAAGRARAPARQRRRQRCVWRRIALELHLHLVARPGPIAGPRRVERIEPGVNMGVGDGTGIGIGIGGGGRERRVAPGEGHGVRARCIQRQTPVRLVSRLGAGTRIGGLPPADARAATWRV